MALLAGAALLVGAALLEGAARAQTLLWGSDSRKRKRIAPAMLPASSNAAERVAVCLPLDPSAFVSSATSDASAASLQVPELPASSSVGERPSLEPSAVMSRAALAPCSFKALEGS